MIHLKNAGLLSAALIALSSVSSFSADIEQPRAFHPYIGLFGGVDILPSIAGSDTFSGSGSLNSNIGDVGGAVIGAEFNNNWRVEAELSRSYNSVNNFTFNNGNVNTYNSGAVNQTYALANVWHDFRNKSAFTPYVGGGLGLGWADGNLNGGSGIFATRISATAPAAFAFQVGAGVTYEVSDRFSIDVGYRFKAMTGLNATVTEAAFFPVAAHLDQTSIGSHNFQIGATLRF